MRKGYKEREGGIERHWYWKSGNSEETKIEKELKRDGDLE